MSRTYQVYLRTARGGAGIPREHALFELRAVFKAALAIRDDRPRRWITAHIDLDESEVARLGQRLGYTEGIVSALPIAAPIAPGPKGPYPWSTGLGWDDGRPLALRPVVVPPQPPRGRATGTGRRRSLSELDARFLCNVLDVADGARVVDPFAGAGTLARAAAARGLMVSASDIDPGLMERLAAADLDVNVADARALSFDDASFDGLVTEPPYRSHERGAVLESVAEWARVLRPGGRAVVLVAAGMTPELLERAARVGLARSEQFRIERHGLSTDALCLERSVSTGSASRS